MSLNFFKNWKIYFAAKQTKSSIKYDVLNAAWGVYQFIKENNRQQYGEIDSQILPSMKNCWNGISKLVEYKGNLSKFKSNEQELLVAVIEGYTSYDDLIHVLIDHHNDKDAANYLFQKFPEIQKLIPKQYNNTQQVLEVVLELIRNFQWSIESFSNQFSEDISHALKI